MTYPEPEPELAKAPPATAAEGASLQGRAVSPSTQKLGDPDLAERAAS